MYFRNSPPMYNKFPYYPWTHNQMFYTYQDQPLHKNTRDESDKEKDKLLLTDYGPGPLSVNLKKACEQNDNFRTVLWTGNGLQVVLMSLERAFSIDPYFSKTSDQIINVVDGSGLVKIGNSKDSFDYQSFLNESSSIIVPLNKWVTVLNLGNDPLKLYIIYAPPLFASGTLNKTKEDAKKS